MKFLLCSCDEETFTMVIGTSPVVGAAERFVVPCDVYFEFTDLDVPPEHYAEEMAELGITLLSII
jgi:hypothetical protein